MKTIVKTAVFALLVLALGLFLLWRVERDQKAAESGYENVVTAERMPSEHSTVEPELPVVPAEMHIKPPIKEVTAQKEKAGPWIKILNYHEIFPESIKKSKDLKVNRFCQKPSDLMLIVTTEDFDKQMEFLSKNYKCVKMSDFGKRLEEKDAYTENVVIVTFDGADKTIYEQAYPILKKYNIPATLFLHINSVNLDKTSMKWDTIAKIHAEGLMEIESHSISHPHLNRKNKGESEEAYEDSVRKELVNSKAIIEEKLGKKVYYFAYPYGGYNSVVMRLLKETGYKAAVTVQWDKNTVTSNPYALKRRGIFGTFSFKQFTEVISKTFKDDTREYAD